MIQSQIETPESEGLVGLGKAHSIEERPKAFITRQGDFNMKS